MKKTTEAKNVGEKFVISGRIFTKGIDGMPRYAAEIIKRLDSLIGDEDIELALPQDCDLPFELKKIGIVRLGKNGKGWGLRQFNRYVKEKKAIEINFSNTCSFQKSIVCLHDIIPLQMKGEFGKNFRKPRLAMKFWIHLIKRHALQVVTVSEYSRSQIAPYLGKKPIAVIGNGYEHISAIEEDEGIFEKFPGLQRGGYYFTLGNVSPHKNLNWVFENAKRYPENTYVIAGKIAQMYKDDIAAHAVDNVIYAGYVSDGEMKALIKNAKSLLFPTLIEGFGIPPLEALALGTPAICSDIPCLKEIYGGCVRYIDPHDPSADLDALLGEAVEAPDVLFETYNWEQSAREWYALIKEVAARRKNKRKD